MTIENPFTVLGITSETPYDLAKSIYKERALPLYPNGSTTPETFDEFDLLTQAWRKVANQLPRQPRGINSVGLACSYDRAGLIEPYTPAQHSIDLLA